MNKNLLRNPYYLNNSPAFRIWQAALFGLFVFLFLFIFQPFQIHLLEDELLFAAAGFGAITFMMMLVLNVLVPLFFRNFFEEEKWTVGKEVFYTLLNIWLIGLFNFLFFDFFFARQASLHGLWWFQFSTLAVGIFPVAFITLFKERKSRTRYVQEARSLFESLQKEPPPEIEKNQDTILIRSKNQHEAFEVAVDKLFYFKSADNYVEVYFYENALQKRIIRNTLKELETDLSPHQRFFRCHKSYIINLEKVRQISGNAQGYQLHLPDTSQLIPVSRQNNNTIKERLSRHS